MQYQAKVNLISLKEECSALSWTHLKESEINSKWNCES